MTKRNYKFSTVLICMLLSCFLLVGCNFLFSGLTVKTLDTPVIGLDRENKSLNWHTVDKADKYNIYINDEMVETVENIPTKNVQEYSFADDLDKFGYYKFKVQALSDKSTIKKSSTSVSITFVYTNKDASEIQTKYNIIYGEETNSPIDIVLNDGVVTWSEVAGAKHYVVVAYTMLHGVTLHETEEQQFDIVALSNNEIVLFSVGAYFEVENMLYVYSPERYAYNPESQGKFTDQVYLFDEYVGDYYIQSMEELVNITYYNFINRTTVYDIRFAESFLEDIGVSTFSNDRIRTNILKKIDNCFEITKMTGPFFETCQFESVSGYSSFGKKLAGELDYQIAVSFYGVEECDTSLYSKDYGYPSYNQNNVEHPYYENFADAEGRRIEEYDEFVSDKYFLTDRVTTSEQLYWAVENKVTPLVEEGSRAQTIYNKAKEVLREIIHPSMSDYEKALSIFDWITVNTAYDNAQPEMFEANSLYITESCAYYLEGVFLQGVAVCDGFSKAYSLLCNMEGIECIRITGMAGGPHAWNKVKIDGDFYLVDITWTEIKAKIIGKENEGVEYLTHKYFLLADRAVTTHKPYQHRPKYSHYATALDNYNYYANRVVSYKNQDGEIITEDFVIESDQELYNLMRYFLVNNTPSVDIVFTRSYVSSLITRNGDSVISAKTIEKALMKILKEQKYPVQMLDTICSYHEGFYWLDTKGTDAKNHAIIFYMSFDLIIDEAGELEDFVSYMKAVEEFSPGVLENYNQSTLYISEVILEGVPGLDAEQKIQNYITLLGLTDDMEVVYSGLIIEKKFYSEGSEQGITEYLYICTLTLKS